MVVEFRAAYGAILAAALDKLDDAEPVEGMVARKTSPLGHEFLANRAFFSLGLGIIDQRVMGVDVPEKSPELSELVHFRIELSQQTEGPLADEDLEHG